MDVTLTKNHKYVTSDGKKLDSVSDYVSIVSAQIYKDIDKEILADSQVRGSTVHKGTVTLDNEHIAEVPYEYSGYLDAYVKFLKEHDVRWFSYYTERSMRCRDEFAGTIDRFGDVDGKLTIADFKTNSKISGKNLVAYEVQLNLYRRILEAHEQLVQRLLIVHLMKDGNYQLYDINVDDTLADMCIYIYNRLKERKKRRKSNG